MAISMNQLIPITSNVVNSSAIGVTLAGVFLTENSLIPNNLTQSTLQFFSPEQVGAFFGLESPEYAAALIYFASYTGTTAYPAFCWFSLYIAALQNASISSNYITGTGITATLSQFQAITSGNITFHINGTAYAVPGIDLHTASSYSQVGALILAALQADFPGTFASATFTFNGANNAFTFNTGFATGTDTITYCTSSASVLAQYLQFDAADFAVLSQGSPALTPAENMDAVIAVTRNWCSFTHIFDVSGDNTYAVDLALSAWASSEGTNYCYVQYNPVSPAAELAFNTLLLAATYANVIPNYGDITTAAFVMGMNASVNYSRLNSTISDAYKQQAGLVPFVTTDAVASELIAAGVNFYGMYATKAQIFNFYQQGIITGQWKFIDNFFNQVWLADQIQVNLAVMFEVNGKIPNNSQGYGILGTTLKTVMQLAINNGVAETGNTFSPAQTAELQVEAGYDITPQLTNAGYVVQIIPATPSERAARQAPETNVWYSNGSSILTLPVNVTYVF